MKLTLQPSDSEQNVWVVSVTGTVQDYVDLS